MKKNKENTCNCGHLDYPHQAGSSVWCIEHKTGPTEDDYKTRYGR